MFIVIRLYLESESDKDMPAIMQLRLHFANFIYKMITSVPGKSNCSRFHLFAFHDNPVAVKRNSNMLLYCSIKSLFFFLISTAPLLSNSGKLKGLYSLLLHLMVTRFIVLTASLRRNLLPDDLRCNLFFLFSSWCAHFGVKSLGLEK